MTNTPNPNDFSLEKVKHKYESAIRMLEHNRRTDIPTYRQYDLNSAGMLFSDAIEYAIKLHMQQNWSAVSSPRLYNNFNIPTAIESLYLNKEGVPLSLYNRIHAETKVNPNEIDFELIKNRTVYSNNTHHKGINLLEADVFSIRKAVKNFINCYLDPSPLKTEENFCDHPEVPTNLYHDLDGFNGDDTVYVLLNWPQTLTSSDYGSLARVDWSLIIDFDTDSFSESGFGGVYGRENIVEILTSKNIKSGISQQKIHKSPGQPIFYLANGDDTESGIGKIESLSYVRWMRTLKRGCSSFIKVYCNSILNDGIQRLVILSLIPDTKFNQSILEDFMAAAPANVDISFRCFDSGFRENEYEEGVDVKFVDCSPGDICEIIEEQLPPVKTLKTDEVYHLPYRKEDSAAKGILKPAELSSYERFMDVLVLEDRLISHSRMSKKDFFQGVDRCSWFGIDQHWPVNGKQYKRLLKTIKTKLTYHSERIHRIAHDPGVGGTTLTRMIAWDLHGEYPSVWLHSYDKTILPELFYNLYKTVRCPIVVFVEVPEVMEYSELKWFATEVNQTLSVIFIAVGRKATLPSDSTFPLGDWGNDMEVLVQSYRPFLNELDYTEDEKVKKEHELDRLAGTEDASEKTPFVVGLTTFDRNYQGIKRYVENFKGRIGNNPLMTSTLNILALCDLFNHSVLPTQLFKNLFSHSDSSRPFSLRIPFKGTGIVGSLIREEKNANGVTGWRLVNPVLTMRVLKCFGGLKEDESNLEERIYSVASEFVDLCGNANTDDFGVECGSCLYEELLTRIFIDRTNPNEAKFAPIITKLSDQHKIRIFERLCDRFPNNPHFHSHLGRCYAKIDRDMYRALEMTSKAIDMSENPDAVLYHIRGECYRTIIKDRIEKASSWNEVVSPENDFSLEQCVADASYDYVKTRQLQREARHLTKYGYISHIHLLMNVIEAAKRMSGIDVKQLLTQKPYSEWWEDLQEVVQSFDADSDVIVTIEDDVEYEVQVSKSKLYSLIDDYSAALRIIDNALQQNESPSLRRINVFLRLNGPLKDKNYRNNEKINERIRTMMEKNLTESFSIKDFLPWFEAVRFSNLKIKDVVDKINCWRGIASSVEPTLEFYAYVLNTILAYQGSATAAVEAARALSACKKLRPYSIKIVERIGKPEVVSQMRGWLTKSASVVEKSFEFKGRVMNYDNPGSGRILPQGLMEELKVFFKPGVNDLDDTCKNHDVLFTLGFSYDGPRADKVRLFEHAY